MKITAIKSFPVHIGARNQMLVKVETDQGLHGWGESGMTSRERAVAGAVEHYAQFLVGRDPQVVVATGDMVSGGRVRSRAHVDAGRTRDSEGSISPFPKPARTFTKMV